MRKKKKPSEKTAGTVLYPKILNDEGGVTIKTPEGFSLIEFLRQGAGWGRFFEKVPPLYQEVMEELETKPQFQVKRGITKLEQLTYETMKQAGVLDLTSAILLLATTTRDAFLNLVGLASSEQLPLFITSTPIGIHPLNGNPFWMAVHASWPNVSGESDGHPKISLHELFELPTISPLYALTFAPNS